MIRLAQSIALFSIRLKGPTSQRRLLKLGIVKQPIIQDHFVDYYENTLQLYKNNFTPEQLKNASQSIKRVFSLQNAAPAQILKFRIQQAVKKYQKNFCDHGSAGVQCAVMSERIILLMMHVKKYPKDYRSARALNYLLDQRRLMLNYLVNKDFHMYNWVCSDYSIPQTHKGIAIHRRDFAIRQNTYKVTF